MYKKLFQDLSIRKKLIFSMMFVNVCIVLAATAIHIAGVYRDHHKTQERNVELMSSVISQNINTALDYLDKSAATKFLQALAPEGSIVRACVYDQTDEIFAKFEMKDYSCSSEFDPSKKQDSLQITKGIWLNGEPLGTLLIEYSNDTINTVIARKLSTVLIILFSIMVLGYLFINKVQHFISKPIIDLEHYARALAINPSFKKRLSKESHDEIGSLVDAFNTMAAELSKRDEDFKQAQEFATKATRTKSEFLATMSHEIRTPLNAIIGMSDLLATTKMKPEQSEYLKSVRQASYNLLNIINDILDFSKLESNILNLQNTSFELSPVAKEVIEQFEAQAHTKHIDIFLSYDKNIPQYVKGDQQRIRQIITNLVSNAVKFTNSGFVELRMQLLSESEEKCSIKFVVKDSGVGIDTASQKQIFNQFTQADTSTTRKYGGTGLGLAICKDLLTIMGTEIDLESVPRKGSSFSFTLNMDKGSENDVEEQVKDETLEKTEAPKMSEIPSPEFIDMHEMRVLLAEDSQVNQQFATALLDKWNCKVELAQNGAEAVAMYRKHAYDIILMDISMPVMDGYEATEEIRDIERGNEHKTPIIALTANVTSQDKSKALKSGMDDFIPKPFKMEILLEKLVRWGTQTNTTVDATTEVH